MKLPPRVLPVTPGRCATGGFGALLKDLTDIKAAGAEGVLLREKALPDLELLELAKEAREIFCDGWLGVHDRAHVALLVGADAVHIGRRSLVADVVAGVVGEDMSVGLSQHEPELCVGSIPGSYRFLSPIYAPISKPLDGEELGLSSLARASLKEQTWALGGVTHERLSGLFSTGVAGVAAVGEIFDGRDVGGNMARLLSHAELAGERHL